MKSIVKYATVASLVNSQLVFPDSKELQTEKFLDQTKASPAEVKEAGPFDIDDRNHDVKQIVRENGFDFEEHEVTTEDGYILKVHRVLPGMNPKPKNAPVVLL